MYLTQYPKSSSEGFSADEIRRGVHYLYMDVKCPSCGKWQTVAQTSYIGGPCCSCGKRTDGSNQER